MQKRIWIVLIIFLAVNTFALDPVVSSKIKEEPLPPPARYTNFETDNVHILRLQNFTRAVVQEINQLETEFDNMNIQLNRIQLQLEELQQLMHRSPQANYENQLSTLGTQLTNLQRDIRTASNIQSRVVENVPKQNFAESIPALTIMMMFLFLMFGLLVVWIKNKNQSFDEQKYANIHAQLHLSNYIRHSIDKGESISHLRKHFTSHGWSNDQFDTALEKEIAKK